MLLLLQTLQALGTFFAGCTLFVLAWVKCRNHRQSKLVAQELTRKGEKNRYIALRKMDLMSAIWHRMHLDNESPVIHGFELIPNHSFDVFHFFWKDICRTYINFRSIPVKIGFEYYWKELPFDEIDFDYHIQKIIIDDDPEKFIHSRRLDNGTGVEDFLKHLVNKKVNALKMNRGFDASRPHWEAIYYIFPKHPNLAYGEVRMHHSIADGILIGAILEKHHKLVWPDSYEIASAGKTISSDFPDKSKTSRTKPSMWQIFQMFYHVPWCVYDYFIRFLIFESLAATPLTLDNKYNPNKSLANACNMCVSRVLPLTQLKELSRRYNCTINDLVAALLCCAINKFLRHTMDESDFFKLMGKNESSGVCGCAEKTFYLRFVSVFNVRALAKGNMDKLIKNAQTGGEGSKAALEANALALVPIPLPCGEMEFEERVALIHKIFNHLKYGTTPLASVFAIKFLNMLGGADLVVRFFKSQNAKCFGMWSNLAGPRTLLPWKRMDTVGGRDRKEESPEDEMEKMGNIDNEDIVNVFAMTNSTGVGIACTVMSYAENLTFSLVVDENILDEKALNRLVGVLNKEFTILLE